MKIPGVMLMQKYETATHKVVVLGDVATGGKSLCIAHFTDKVPIPMSVKQKDAIKALDAIREGIEHDRICR